MTEDPLDDLFVKKEEVEGENKALLARMIRPFASMDPETGEVFFNEEGDALTVKHKILVYLLCRLALFTRPNSVFPAAVSPKDIEAGTHIAGGTLRPKLKELADDRVVVKSGDGLYQITGSTLRRAFRELERVIPEA
jgi:hypothetical protein